MPVHAVRDIRAYKGAADREFASALCMVAQHELRHHPRFVLSPDQFPFNYGLGIPEAAGYLLSRNLQLRVLGNTEFQGSYHFERIPDDLADLHEGEEAVWERVRDLLDQQHPVIAKLGHKRERTKRYKVIVAADEDSVFAYHPASKKDWRNRQGYLLNEGHHPDRLAGFDQEWEYLGHIGFWIDRA